MGGGAIWRELLRQREAGQIQMLGVSVGSPAEAETLLADRDVALVQIPCSLLDQRLLRSGLLNRLRASGKDIFVRSIFLQGIAHLGWENMPARLREHAHSLRDPLRLIDAWCAAHSLSRADAFLAFGHCLHGAKVLIGCETAAQLAENLHSWENTKLLLEDIQHLARTMPDLPENVLNPAHWPTLT